MSKGRITIKADNLQEALTELFMNFNREASCIESPSGKMIILVSEEKDRMGLMELLLEEHERLQQRILENQQRIEKERLRNMWVDFEDRLLEEKSPSAQIARPFDFKLEPIVDRYGVIIGFQKVAI